MIGRSDVVEVIWACRLVLRSAMPSLGTSPSRLEFSPGSDPGLQLRALITGLAGFPLRSLTRAMGIPVWLQLFLVACSGAAHEQNKELCVDDPIDSLGFMDEWISVEKPIPHGSRIRVYRSGRFDYDVGACLFYGRGSGQWRLKMDTLFLMSDSAHGCFEFIDFDGGISLRLTQEWMERWRQRADLWSVNVDCDPSEPDWTTVIFNDDRFIIRDDTLRHLSRRVIRDIREVELFSITPKL